MKWGENIQKGKLKQPRLKTMLKTMMFPDKELVTCKTGARANQNYGQHSNWAAHGGKSHNHERVERKREQLLKKNRELFKEHSLYGHDNASDGDVWREAFANYSELVKNGSEPGFVGSDECRQHWNTAVFQQCARDN
jgi:hypothetical protein